MQIAAASTEIRNVRRSTVVDLAQPRAPSSHPHLLRPDGGSAGFAAGNLLGFRRRGRRGRRRHPGGLFELMFAIWLITRGFASTATVRSRAST